MVQRVPTCGKELAVRRKVGQTLSPESCEDLAIGTIALMIEEQPHLSLFNDPEDGQQPNDKGHFSISGSICKLHFALLCVDLGNRIV